MSVEEWKVIPGYSWYEASSLGRVRSYKKPGRYGGARVLQPRILKPGKISRFGHLAVNLRCDDGVLKGVQVHRAVMLAFNGPIPDHLEVCHNDGDPGNNHRSNLRIDTRKGNLADRIAHGTLQQGEQINHAKLRERDIPLVFAMSRAGQSQADISKHFGVHQTSISSVLIRKTWRHVPIPA